MGISLVAVGDHTNPKGFNLYKFSEYVKINRSFESYPGGSEISREDYFTTKYDFMLPVALEFQIGSAGSTKHEL